VIPYLQSSLRHITWLILLALPMSNSTVLAGVWGLLFPFCSQIFFAARHSDSPRHDYTLIPHHTLVQARCNNSVRHLAASSPAFALISDCAATFNTGGGVVRVATGTPISMKNSSWPTGEQMQSILAGRVNELWNWWGALAGHGSFQPVDATPSNQLVRQYFL
jgi:hypothetical protein